MNKLNDNVLVLDAVVQINQTEIFKPSSAAHKTRRNDGWMPSINLFISYRPIAMSLLIWIVLKYLRTSFLIRLLKLSIKAITLNAICDSKSHDDDDAQFCRRNFVAV